MAPFQQTVSSFMNYLYLDPDRFQLVTRIWPAALLALVLLSSTFLVTTCRYYIQTRFRDGRFKGLEPVTLPYWIPWIGSGLTVATNPHKFYEYALSVRQFCTSLINS